MKRPLYLVTTALFCLIAALTLGGCQLLSVDQDVAPCHKEAWQAPCCAVPPCKQAPAAYCGEAMSLCCALDTALQNNPLTRQAWEVAKEAAADYGTAKTMYLPTGSISAGIQRQNTNFNPIDGFTGFGGSQTIRSVGVDISYLLFNFGAREAELSSAQQALFAANFAYNQKLQDVALSVSQNYFDLYAAEASVRAWLANLEDAKATLDSTQIRFDAGLADKQANLQARADYESARYQLQAAYSNVEKTRASLALAIGLPVNTCISIIPPASQDICASLDTAVCSLMEKAIQERPVLLSAYAQWQSAIQNEKAAERALLPYITATYSNYKYGGTGTSLNPTSQSLGGIAVQWDVFDLFTDNYARLKAKAQAKAAEASLRESQLKVLSDVWTSFYSFKAASEQLGFAESYFEAAYEAFQANKISYNIGLKTITDLLSSQNTLADARVQQASANSNIAISLAQLAHATGQLELIPCCKSSSF